MPKLKQPVSYETTFETYTVDEQIGEGGAGRVFGGTAGDGSKIALKVLTSPSADKRSRFKNEIAFLQANKHANVVSVIDHGLQNGAPFYVMRRYEGSLRKLIQAGIPSNQAMPLFSQILDGVEGAHLKGVVHRDLKPENILCDGSTLAIADFGIARFTEDYLISLIETGATDRLANFQYAAPEQRVPGRAAGMAVDIYALGLILNEMFTGTVPHGTEYAAIASVSPEHAYLDPIVAQMLRQSPNERPASIGQVKTLIMKHEAEAVSLQRLSQMDQAVIHVGDIDEPLAYEPPKLIGADWERGALKLKLDRPVSRAWVQALHNMGNYTSVMGKPPVVFQFAGDTATVGAAEHDVQPIINHFKEWLPNATNTLRHQLQQEAQRQAARHREELRRQREEEERRLRINQSLRI